MQDIVKLAPRANKHQHSGPVKTITERSADTKKVTEDSGLATRQPVGKDCLLYNGSLTFLTPSHASSSIMLASPRASKSKLSSLVAVSGGLGADSSGNGYILFSSAAED
jgi:hypothetical protein